MSLNSNPNDSQNSDWLRPLFLVGIVIIAAMTRLIPHPHNVTPLAAIALFGGAYFSNRAIVFAVPLLAMLLSDYVIGFYPAMGFIYVSLALIACLGMLLHGRRSAPWVAGASIVGSVLFFVISNFGYWMMMGTYTMDFAGLVTCYVAAIPFFWNTLAGDLVFVSMMFGGYQIATRFVPVLRMKGAVA